MAQTSTMYTFDIALSDVGRAIYDSFTVKAACHPSETEEYLATRVLAYCLEYTEGIAFSKGLGEPDEPTISVRDLTGALKAWIDVGAPDAARLHKASKASPRVAVYTHREPRIFLRAYEGERIHRAEALELYAIDRDLLAEFVRRLDRRMRFALTITEGELYLDFSDGHVTGSVQRLTLG
jgi:uncharacterized protein YaeQ